MGNLKMVYTLESDIALYESVGVREKSAVNADVTKKLIDNGARFLKMEGDVWQPVDERFAREKVSHCFRTRIRINGSTVSHHGDQSDQINSCSSSNGDFKRAHTVMD